MCKIAIVFACLACAGYGRRVAFNPSGAGLRPASEARNAQVAMAESLKKGALKVTRSAWGSELKETLSNYAAEHFPRHAGLAAGMLESMDSKELKRHALAASMAVAMTLSSNLPALAEDLNPANIAVNQGGLSNFASFLAVILGLSIPCVFLITLFIQSEAQGTATTYRQPDSIGGTRYEDE
mmetsp:Transcript_163482/g.313976  ORF Transcript_163482/g.313976 Transcript_163482/m.313976 type:complete len:182 (-) Transcript_163482:158-703(-)